MSQKNAFIIDDDRDFALKMAAALRTDGLKVGLSEGDRDPLDEIKLERPDVVVVRAEGKNNESGFSICNRLKKSKRWARTSVFLYSADTNGKKFDKHRNQSTPADGYLMVPDAPPYPFEEIRNLVKDMLFPADGTSMPPPLPAPRDDVKPVTPEDTAFIEKVMDSLVSTGDEEAPARVPVKREPTLIGRRTTADHKLDMLRQKLRQRESELAKVMDMYRAKEREYHEWNEKLVERDVEAQSLRMTIEELSNAHQSTQSELDQRTTEFNASFESLLEEKVHRENELIQVVAGKEKDLSDVQVSLSQAQREAEAEGKALTESLEGLEADLATAGTKIDELETTLGDREQALEELEKDLSDAKNQIASFEATVAEQVDALAENEAGHLELQAKILELRADLAATRDELDAQARTQSYELAGRTELIEGLRQDLSSTEANAAQMEADLSDELQETKASLSEEQAALEAKTEFGDALQVELRTLEALSSEKEAGLSADVSRLEDSEASLQAELAQAQEQIEDQEAVSTSQKAEAEALKLDLEGQVAERIGQIEVLDGKLANESAAHEATREDRAQNIERLEGELMSAEQAAREQAEQLSGTIKQREGTISEREAEVERLEGDLTDVRGQLSAANDEGASLNIQIEDERDRFEVLERQSLDAKASFEAEAEELSAELARTKEEADTKESELRGQIIGLGTDLAASGDRADGLERDLDAETRERAQAERHGDELDQALADTKAQLGTTTDGLRQTERELGSVRETLALTEGRLSEVQENLRSEQAARESADQTLAELRIVSDQRGADIGRLEGRVAVLDDNNASLKVEQAELEEELDGIKDELSARTSDLASARSEAKERSERLREVGVQLEQREVRNEDLSSKLTELTHQKDQLDAAKEALSAEHARLNAEHASLSSAKDSLDAQVGSLEDQVDELKAEMDTRQGRIESLQESLAETRQMNADLDRAKLGLSGDVARAQEAQTRLQDELGNARQEWDKNRTELLTERDSVRERLKEVGAELDKVRGARDSLERENDKLEEQGQLQTKKDAEEIANLQATLEQANEDHARQAEDLQGRIDQANLERSGLDAELSSTRENLDSEQASHEQTRGDLEGVEGRLEALRAEHEQQQRQAGQAEADLQEKLQEISGQHDFAAQDASRVRAELEARVTQSEADSERLKDALADEKTAHATAKTVLSEEVSGLGERLEEATTRAAALASEKSADGNRYDEHVGQLQARVDELAAAIQGKDRELVDSRSEQGELKSQLDATRRERDDVENRYIKELEEVHDEHMSKSREADSAHFAEVEQLRTQTIDAKRQLKTSQLAAQRLTDRIQKLETERPQRTSAEADFDSFIAGFKDSKLPIPSSVPSKAPRRRPTPSAMSRGLAGTPASSDVPARPEVEAVKIEPVVPTAGALGASAGTPSADKEDDVTMVGKQDGTSRTAQPRRPTRRPKPAIEEDSPVSGLTADLVAEPPKKADDFLDAFDREFKNLKP